jgi:mannose-6-phosphate isomerase-like protein (cupin superfamily)
MSVISRTAAAVPVLTLALATSGLASDWAKLPAPISINEVTWAPAPPVLPSGAEIAVLEGDLSKEEPHLFRLRLPDGYHVAPHSHPMREHITVLEGTLVMGMGETADRSAAAPLPAGSFYALPVDDVHHVWAEGETVLQLHGIGPWGITYVDPADDPSGNQASR